MTIVGNALASVVAEGSVFLRRAVWDRGDRPAPARLALRRQQLHGRAKSRLGRGPLLLRSGGYIRPRVASSRRIETALSGGGSAGVGSTAQDVGDPHCDGRAGQWS